MGRIRGDLLERTFEFAVSIVHLIDGLPNNVKGWEIGKQVLRSGTSVGANIREADHALTDADFTYRCALARKEAAETLFWLQLSSRCRLLKGDHVESAIQEADELVRILATIVKTTQERKTK